MMKTRPTPFLPSEAITAAIIHLQQESLDHINGRLTAITEFASTFRFYPEPFKGVALELCMKMEAIARQDKSIHNSNTLC